MNMVEYLTNLAVKLKDDKVLACAKMLARVSKDYNDLQQRHKELNHMICDLVKQDSQMPCPPCRVGDILYAAHPNMPEHTAAYKVIKIMYTITESGTEDYIQTSFLSLDGKPFGIHTHPFAAVGSTLFPTVAEALRMAEYTKE